MRGRGGGGGGACSQALSLVIRELLVVLTCYHPQ